jgi:carboxypeptidase Q
MKKFFFILLCAPLFAAAQNMTDDSLFIHEIAVNILSSDASYNNLHYLTKNIGGRLSGSPQMYLAEQWGADALQKAGADNVKLQECMVPHWIRGGEDKAFVIYKNEAGQQQRYWLNILALGNSVGTGEKGVLAPLIRVNNFDELEAKKNDLKGKIVFYNNPFDDTLINTFYAYGKNVIYRGIGASRAAKYGASAVIIRSMTN